MDLGKIQWHDYSDSISIGIKERESWIRKLAGSMRFGETKAHFVGDSIIVVSKNFDGSLSIQDAEMRRSGKLENPSG